MEFPNHLLLTVKYIRWYIIAYYFLIPSSKVISKIPTVRAALNNMNLWVGISNMHSRQKMLKCQIKSNMISPISSTKKSIKYLEVPFSDALQIKLYMMYVLLGVQ